MSDNPKTMLLQINVHFEYGEAIERLLDRHGVEQYVRFPMMEGRDHEGKHFGTQAFPGNVTVVQAQVMADRLDALLSDLRAFRDQKPAHRHLQAVAWPIERRL